MACMEMICTNPMAKRTYTRGNPIHRQYCTATFSTILRLSITCAEERDRGRERRGWGVGEDMIKLAGKEGSFKKRGRGEGERRVKRKEKIKSVY